MKEIIVTSKTFGIIRSKVDDQDFEWLSKFNWNISEDKGNLYLSARSVFTDEKLRKIKLHQLLMMPYDSRSFVVDHKNGNTLDNRRENLRLATLSENNRNRKPQRNKKSPYKGVTFWYKKYTATITVNGHRIYGGSFKLEIDAAKKYNELARQHHGEFAYQNPV